MSGPPTTSGSSYREGLSRSLLEAAAADRPLLASNVPGCRDVVEDGLKGLLPVQSAAAIVTAGTRFLVLTLAERQRMGDAARRTAETRFSEEQVIDAYWREIGGLLDRGSKQE